VPSALSKKRPVKRSDEETHLDEVRNVGDVDTNLESAVFVLDDMESVVEVLRGLGVDGEDAVVAKVATDVGLSLACKSKGRKNQLLPSWKRREEEEREEGRVDSRSGIHQGVGGKHFCTLSPKSSFEKLQSFKSAFVSTSMSPIAPSSSTSCPKGWREVIGQRLMQATKRRSW
jgi:hypothetical protein